MNRLGFSLLTLGGILAFLGWQYDHDLFAFFGFLLIAVLSILAATWPTFISYQPQREAAPMAVWERRLWGAYYVFALLMFVAALWHSTAGGHGEVVALAGLALFVALAAFDALHYGRLREWRLTMLRSFRKSRS
jgi:hypothetical protein